MNILLVFVLCISMFLTSCSAMMAVSGSEGTNISVLRTGTPKLLVLQELGEPEYIDEDRNFYKVCKGKDGSIIRGLFHGAMSVLTLGLWEVVGTPVELINMDKKGCFYLFVVYEDERVKRVALEEKYIKKEI